MKDILKFRYLFYSLGNWFLFWLFLSYGGFYLSILSLFIQGFLQASILSLSFIFHSYSLVGRAVWWKIKERERGWPKIWNLYKNAVGKGKGSPAGIKKRIMDVPALKTNLASAGESMIHFFPAGVLFLYQPTAIPCLGERQLTLTLLRNMETITCKKEIVFICL